MISIDNYDFKGKRAIIRVDFNVPLNEKGEVTDDTRIRAAIPTIKKVLAEGGSVILMSHMGRPKKNPDPKYSLEQIVPAVEKNLGTKVEFAGDCIGEKAAEMAKNLKPGQVMLLENLRFYAEEEGKPRGLAEDASKEEKDAAKKALKEGPQKEFVKKLASLADCYINDAFGTAHRKHASTYLIAKQFPNDKMFEAIKMAHEENQKIIALIDQMVSEVGKPKFEYPHADFNQELFDKIVADFMDEAKAAMDTDDKNVREARWNQLIEKWHELFLEDYPEMDKYLDEITYKFQKKIVKAWLREGHRVDGRQKNEIRPLSAEVGVLPRVHGSGLFTRGQTQVLSVATLDTLSANQKLDTIWEETEKRYMHHYNFPGYSVGEAKPARSPGRREIGHGALAERALVPVLPSVEEFPYAIRVVSEVLSSNGSTSQGSICGTTLALMDAGVPLKAPVAGISCGLIQDGDNFTTFIDIQGVEDFHGDMDFKVGGTRRGITAIQMDIKVDGLTYEIVEEALEKCRKGRLYILDQIIKPVIAEPRAELSKYAPKMFSMMIPVDKIKDVIGKGGKVIQDICATCNCKIDVQEDGHVFVSAVDQEDAKRAIFTIKTIVEDPEIGAIYKGKVTRLMNFGAFVEIAPGKEGLVHISKLDTKRVDRVEDVVAVGDAIVVKVTDIDQQGRINLSRRDAILALEAKRAEQAQQ
mgnify:CR=1 FL=1